MSKLPFFLLTTAVALVLITFRIVYSSYRCLSIEAFGARSLASHQEIAMSLDHLDQPIILPGLRPGTVFDPDGGT